MRLKFIVFLLTLVVFSQLWSCSSHNYIIFDQVRFDMTHIVLDSFGMEQRRLIDDDDTVSVQDIQTTLSSDFRIGSLLPNFSIRNTAYAFQYNKSYTPLNRIESVELRLLYDYNDNFRAGDDVFKAFVRYNVTTKEEVLKYLNNFQEPFNTDKKWIADGLKSPNGIVPFGLQIILTDNNGTIIHAKTNTFYVQE